MKRQFRDWDKLYAQYKQTNLSIAAFAEKRKIPLSVAYKQFHKRSVQNDTDVTPDDVSFVPVTITSVGEKTIDVLEKEQSNKVPEIIVDAGKFTLHIPNGFDEEFLSSILKVIGGLC